MVDCTSFSQVAFTFLAASYRRNHTQHRREYADNRNRRHTNLLPNLQYTAHLRGLQTVLIVEKTVSNHFYILKTLNLAKRRLYTVKERYQRSKDNLFGVTQNELFPEDIKDI